MGKMYSNIYQTDDGCSVILKLVKLSKMKIFALTILFSFIIN